MVPGDNKMFKELESDAGLQIEEVSELDNDSLLLGITIDNFGVVTSTLSSSDTKEIEEYKLDVEFVDSNGSTCTLETNLGIRVQLQLRAVYSKSNKVITSIEIDDIYDYNCPYCPY